MPSVIIHSLNKLGYSEANKLHCNAVLLSHHGSAGNNSSELLKMIKSDRYIISSDGINKHCLPNKKTIARIINTASSLPVSLYFNYRDGRLGRMFKTDNSEEVRLMIDLHYLGEGEAIEFL